MSHVVSMALNFLINTVFDFYLYILTIRLVLAFVSADYYDPVTQFIVKLTNFIIRPLRRTIPDWHGIELSTLLVILILEILRFTLLTLLNYHLHNVLGLLVLSLVDCLALLIQTFFYAILIQAILSWIQPSSPANRVLYQMTYPVIQPFRKMIPPLGGIDISPIPALILLQFLMIVVIQPLMLIGWGITRGIKFG